MKKPKHPLLLRVIDKTLFLLFLCFSVNKTYSQYLTIPAEYERYVAIADSLSEKKLYSEASFNYRNAFIAFGWRGTPDDRYKAARTFGLLNNYDSTLISLSNLCSVNRYWNYLKVINDSAFTFLKQSNEWVEIINCMKVNKEKYAKDVHMEWSNFLDTIYNEDQRYRIALSKLRNIPNYDSTLIPELYRKMAKADSINIHKVSAFIDKYGWQGSEVVGNSGNIALFLVIQHANIDMQEKYLPVMKAAAEQKKVSLQNLALLEDRISVTRNGYQIYGSQLSFDPATGKHSLFPIKDENDVNKRRSQMGLEPLENYLKQFGISYTPVKQ